MSIILTKEAKNITALTMEERISSPTWDEMDRTWDESTSTWDRQSTLFENETKNIVSLTLEPRI